MADSRNACLHKAKKAKNDEFYTRYEDIEAEMQHYDLSGMTVYCPCDDWRWSNFVKYFKNNFERHGLKMLIATNYDIGDGAWKYTYDGKNETADRLEGNGDFRSDECTKIMQECDVVITNPPFSLWRDFVKWIMDAPEKKKLIVLGTLNVLTYDRYARMLIDRQLALGYTKRGGATIFIQRTK